MDLLHTLKCGCDGGPVEAILAERTSAKAGEVRRAAVKEAVAVLDAVQFLSALLAGADRSSISWRARSSWQKVKRWGLETARLRERF